MSRPKLRIRLATGSTVQVTGREAETLLHLMSAGRLGITPLDAHPAGPAFRLAAYVHDLKVLGIPIEMERENHPGGWHGRYRLACEVSIIWRSGQSESEAA